MLLELQEAVAPQSEKKNGEKNGENERQKRKMLENMKLWKIGVEEAALKRGEKRAKKRAKKWAKKRAAKKRAEAGGEKRGKETGRGNGHKKGLQTVCPQNPRKRAKNNQKTKKTNEAKLQIILFVPKVVYCSKNAKMPNMRHKRNPKHKRTSKSEIRRKTPHQTTMRKT